MKINLLASLVRQQADRLFPKRTDSSMFLKMYGELGELISAKTPEQKAGEFADVMIMLLDYADKNGIDVQQSVETKMGINERRTWVVNDLGVFQHVQ